MDEQELKKYRIPDDEYRNHNIITDPPNEAGLDLDDVNGIANEILEYAIPLISAEARKQERERIIRYLERHNVIAKVYGVKTVLFGLALFHKDYKALKEGGKEAE